MIVSHKAHPSQPIPQQGVLIDDASIAVSAQAAPWEYQGYCQSYSVAQLSQIHLSRLGITPINDSGCRELHHTII